MIDPPGFAKSSFATAFSHEEQKDLQKIGKFPTLRELDEDEVRIGFWGGRVVAAEYVKRICSLYTLPCKDKRFSIVAPPAEKSN